MKLASLLAWLFVPSLDALLRKAAGSGAVLLQDLGGSEEHGGTTWQCTVRPPSRARRGSMNCWTGSGGSPTAAVRDVLAEIETNPRFDQEPAKFAPRLGGKEFDE